MEGPRKQVDLPEVDGRVGRVWDEHTGGVHHGPSTDDRGVCGNPPDLNQMQERRAEEGSSTILLVVGATDGLGRQQCNWIRRVIVRSTSHPAARQRGKHEKIGLGTPRALFSLFLVESTSVGYDDGILCVP